MSASSHRPWPTPRCREGGRTLALAQTLAQAPALGERGDPKKEERARFRLQAPHTPFPFPSFVFLQSTKFLLMYDMISPFVLLTVSLAKM